MISAGQRAPKALLLDIDNTVYSYQPCHAAGLKSAFVCSAKYARWESEAEFHKAYASARCAVKSRLRMTAASHSRLLYFKELIEAQLRYTDLDRVKEIDECYWAGYASQLSPEPGCVEVLRRAARYGVKLAWVSNFTTERQMWKLTRLGLGDVESLLVTSEDAGAEKPNPAIVDLALRRLGVSPDEAWFIGDEPADEEVARLRGLPMLLMQRRDAGSRVQGWGRPVAGWEEIGEVLRHARN